MWIQIPDPPMTRFDQNNYGPGYRESISDDPMKNAKVAVRFYKSILAEEGRKEEKKKEEEKKKAGKKGMDIPNLQPVLFWTLPFVGLGYVYLIKSLSVVLDAMFK